VPAAALASPSRLDPDSAKLGAMHRDRLQCLGAALAAVATLSACSVPALPGRGPAASQPGPPGLPRVAAPGPYRAQPAPRPGGTITVGSWQFPTTLSPYLGGQTVAAPVLQAIDDGLLGSAPDLGWYGDLARDVPTPENGGVRPVGDGMDVTYRLRGGLTWSDGQPVTPDDVLFTYQVITGPGRAAGLGQEGYDRIASVEVSGEDAVVIHFRSLFPAYRSLFPVILPGHRLRAVPFDRLAADPFWSKPDVVSGPFVVDGVGPDRVTLRRNPGYGAGRLEMPFLGHAAYADRVVFRAFPSRQAVLAALKAGDIQVAIDLTERELPTVARLAGTHVDLAPSLGYEQVSLNQASPNPATGVTPPWVGDPAVAEALDLALDRPGLARRLDGPPATATPISPLLGWAFDGTAAAPGFDLGRARQLLEQDGWVAGADGVRVKNGRRLAFFLSTIADQQQRATERDLLVQDWRLLGADVRVQDFPVDQLFASFEQGGVLARGGYEAALWSWIPAPDPDSEYDLLDSSAAPAAGAPGRQNYSRCHDPMVDQALEQGRGTLDQVRRAAAYRTFQAAYLRARCELPLYRRMDIGVTTPRLHNFALNPGPAGNTWNLADWWLGDPAAA
jgi:peptide/nickel transport system substrate-binding protein